MPQTDFINTEHFFKSALENLKIDENRKQLLTSIAKFIASELRVNKRVNLNFICTYNNIRSQLSQVWASYATYHYKLSEVKCFSGGITETAFHRNTVKTLQEVGFSFQIIEFSHQNPVYAINYKNGVNPIIGFSKLFDNDHIKKPFIAITTFSNADENCPLITEAIETFHLPFNDPKTFDYSLYQSQKYLEVNQQIAAEIHFIFKTVHQLI